MTSSERRYFVGQDYYLLTPWICSFSLLSNDMLL